MASASVSPLHLDPASKPGSRWRTWLIGLALAILIHLLSLFSRVDWQGTSAPPKVEIQQVDPAKLDAIRKQWQREAEKEKQILINPDKSRPSDTEAPEDARYMSDRNTRVEKEQRARDGGVVPKAGRPQQQAVPAQPQPRTAPPPEKTAPKHETRPLPKLGNLGIPFQLDKPAPKPKREAQNTPDSSARQAQASELGEQQLLNDREVPLGSENLLNTQESVYYSFYARLYEAIGPIWQSRINEISSYRRLQPGVYTTAVDVVLDSEGNLLEVRMLQSSGISDFDRAVHESWKRIARFPNPPKGLLNERQEVHTGWSFSVHVGEGAAWQFMPPQRKY